MSGYRVSHLDDMPTIRVRPDEPQWTTIRHHFGIESFGINAYTGARAGDCIIGEHDECEPDDQQHEELYFVTAGHATFTLDGEKLDAPQGTFVFVKDTTVLRSAIAEADATTVIVIGGKPGSPFFVAWWEKKYTEGE